MQKAPNCALYGSWRGRAPGTPSLQCAMQSFDVQVCGAGIVGQSLALSLARLGLQVALRAEPPRPQETPGRCQVS